MNPVALTTWATVHGFASLLIEGLLAEETATILADELTRQVTLVLGRGLRSFTSREAGVPTDGRETGDAVS